MTGRPYRVRPRRATCLIAGLSPKRTSVTAQPLSFQRMILKLHDYWSERGCVILQPYDMEMGAGTFHTATTLRALGPDSVERRLRSAPAAGRPTVATVRIRTGSSIITNIRSS